MRELIAELAQLEQSLWPTSTSSFDGDDGRARRRTREGRIVAELRRRHATLRRWSSA